MNPDVYGFWFAGIPDWFIVTCFGIGFIAVILLLVFVIAYLGVLVIDAINLHYEKRSRSKTHVYKPRKRNEDRPPRWKFRYPNWTVVERDGRYWVLEVVYAGEGHSVRRWEKISYEKAQEYIRERGY
jgi:hypothetical protein